MIFSILTVIIIMKFIVCGGGAKNVRRSHTKLFVTAALDFAFLPA
jgi:hypothetical protein